MSAAAVVWAMTTVTGHPLSRWLLVTMADYADANHRCTANLDWLCHRTEMPLRSVHHHLKALTTQGLITPVLGTPDQHGRTPLIGYRLALEAFTVSPTGPTPQAGKTRQRRPDGQEEAQKQAIRDDERAPAVAPPISVTAGSRAWWAIFWRRVMTDEATSYMVAEGEQGRPFLTLDPLPSDEDEAALVELDPEQEAAWEVWLAGVNARFPIHDTPDNPGKIFAPHHWPRELV